MPTAQQVASNAATAFSGTSAATIKLQAHAALAAAKVKNQLAYQAAIHAAHDKQHAADRAAQAVFQTAKDANSETYQQDTQAAQQAKRDADTAAQEEYQAAIGA